MKKNVQFENVNSDESSDDDSINSQFMVEVETAKWDVFQDPPKEVKTGSMEDTKYFDLAEKIAKILAYIITFFFVLICAMLSKGSLLFITSQIRNTTRDCCNEEFGKYQQFIVSLPLVERVSWIWVLFFIYCVPQAGLFFRAVRVCFFKSWDKPDIWEIVSIFVTESLPAIGSALFVYCVLPELDVVKGAMLTNAVCFVPGFIGFISRDPKEKLNSMSMILDMLSLVGQASSFVVWPLLEGNKSLWLIPVSVLLISVQWWENYVSKNSPIPFIKKLGKTKETFSNSRYFIYAFVTVWKVLLFFITMIIIFQLKYGTVSFLFDNFLPAFSDHNINITEIKPIISSISRANLDDIIMTGPGTYVTATFWTPVVVFIINIVSTYFCYGIGKFACKIMIQRFSFAFPLNLSVPVTVTGLIVLCGIYNNDICAYKGVIPVYLFFESPPILYLKDFLTQQHAWIWLLWLLSQTWITIHIWYPRCEKLAKTEQLFMRPMYDAFFIDQDVAMNRRHDDRLKKRNEEEMLPDDPHDEAETSLQSNEQGTATSDDHITRVYACGTMWHETTDEMMEFLKSVMRLDADQHSRRVVRDYWEVNYPGYYELETHVFFDDAFIRRYKDDPEPKVNDFVKMLVGAVDEAASEVHGTIVRVRPPKKYVTPYGGRLEWILPGKTKMITHMKDKMLIRPKKRWSQCMYMYYLLGHRLMERDDLSQVSKEIRARNTYILALDGDIDFQPNALHLLVELMKKNNTLGAACGRIHPIGSGPMVWYQMFEYAVGHWLQKATEHVIGCVLCSPGCFSLFRGSALMDHNVMKKYTTRSTEPMHYVQYDQGEDRWLCTLLLQRGYRVEYSAASDAFTHCPEKFNEFYNQRRRWMPSTTANILDLLMAAGETMKVNDNISIYYIFYQGILMVGTVLGPGTIFLMLVGAFVAAFQTDQWTSFLLNLIPILVFMFVCFMFKSDKIQLFFAGLISAVYGLIMMAVLVGVMLQMQNDGFLAPSSLFFFCVAGEFIITAILHPKEFRCLPYGIVYYVTVPSMYMLLVIYSVFNMNNVSWGTREVTVVQQQNPNAPAEVPAAPAKKKEEGNKLLAMFSKSNSENTGAMEFSLAGLFKCLWCTHYKEPEENKELNAIKDSLNTIIKKLDAVESQPFQEKDTEHKAENLKPEPTIIEGYRNLTVPDSNSVDTQSIDIISTNSWIEDEDLLRGEIDYISNKEIIFWKGLIDKYLHPIDDTKDKQRILEGLIDLRDKAVFSFFMLNSLFVLVIFLLTLKKDILHINWPLDIKRNITYKDDEEEISIKNGYLQLEPIGFVFLIFFALLLIIQFIAMLIHRFGTLEQILASTPINFTSIDHKTISAEEINGETALLLAKSLQTLADLEDDPQREDDHVSRRKTVQNLTTKSNRPTVNDLGQAVKRRLAKYQAARESYKGPVNADIMESFVQRRKTIKMNRRKSAATIGRPSIYHYNNPAFNDDAEC